MYGDLLLKVPYVHCANTYGYMVLANLNCSPWAPTLTTHTLAYTPCGRWNVRITLKPLLPTRREVPQLDKEIPAAIPHTTAQGHAAPPAWAEAFTKACMARTAHSSHSSQRRACNPQSLCMLIGAGVILLGLPSPSPASAADAAFGFQSDHGRAQPPPPPSPLPLSPSSQPAVPRDASWPAVGGAADAQRDASWPAVGGAADTQQGHSDGFEDAGPLPGWHDGVNSRGDGSNTSVSWNDGGSSRHDSSSRNDGGRINGSNGSSEEGGRSSGSNGSSEGGGRSSGSRSRSGALLEDKRAWAQAMLTELHAQVKRRSCLSTLMSCVRAFCVCVCACVLCVCVLCWHGICSLFYTNTRT